MTLERQDFGQTSAKLIASPPRYLCTYVSQTSNSTPSNHQNPIIPPLPLHHTHPSPPPPHAPLDPQKMPPSKPPAPSTWVETETGNKVSRLAQLHGTQHITLGGRCVLSPSVCIRGDLVRPAPSTTSTSTSTETSKSQSNRKPHPITSVTLGKYVILSPGVLLKPALRYISSPATSDHKHPPSQEKDKEKAGGCWQHTPLTIGSHVYIGPGCTVSAAMIGDHVVLESGCVVGDLAILKDGCRVLRGAVVPGGMVVAPGMVVAGRPARVVGEVGVGWGVGEDEGAGGGGGGDLREVWRAAGR